jgi:hypothetical protein
MIRRFFIAFTIAAAAAMALTAQEAASTTEAQPQLIRETDSNQTREELNQLLRRLPPQVGKVLKLDPTLWKNESYMKNYPGLAAFIAEHPDVANSPQFFLEQVWIPGDATPETASMSFWRDMMQGVMVFIFMLTGTLVLAWLIRILVEQRRWSRISRVQTEVHSKLLDRFASNDELLAYIQSPSGRHFLESSPAAPEFGRRVSAPIGRILLSVQAGLVLIAGGGGLQFVSRSVDKEAAAALSGIGVLAIAIGIGFIASAAASYILSRRMGLWDSAGTPAAEVGR